MLEKNLKYFLVTFTLGALFLSCSNKLGYGVVNWSMPEYNLTAGDIIPIYVKSNIEKMYIVGLNDKTKVRITIPLWQLSFFDSRKKAFKLQQKMKANKYNYAIVKFDGLPMRITPENTAKQVYRLREHQHIKILWAGKGVPVLKGGEPLDGKWYEVLTQDGVKGWCFSYNLQIYDEREDLALQTEDTEKQEDEKLKSILNANWYPESYRKMINNRQIDLDKISLSWGFFPGAKSGIARIELEDLTISFPYEKISKLKDKYSFNGANLFLQIRDKNIITVEFSDKAGKPRVENFIIMNKSPEEIISNEIKRRNALIEKIVSVSSEFFSENFGNLKVLSDGQFIWTGYNLISPSIIPANAGSSGKVFINCFISNKIKTQYDGVLNFKFENIEEPVLFMYDVSSKGLRLEAVEKSNIKDSIIERRSLNPVILFFAAN